MDSTIQVNKDHYKHGYNTEGRLFSYWYQVDAVQRINPDSTLEIGVGNGFVSEFLKSQGYDITTIDLDERLQPDKVGSVLHLPFQNETFDLVASFQVLEHLKYKDFVTALREMSRVTKKYVVLSLPDCSRTLRFGIQLPRVSYLKLMVTLPQIKRPVHCFDGEHYWEIGKLEFPIGRIKSDIIATGFKLLKTYRVFEYPFHRFFILEKKTALRFVHDAFK